MTVPGIGAGEASVAVLALLIVKELVSHILSGKRRNNTEIMTNANHEKECKLKLKPIHDGITDLKMSSKSNREAIDRNFYKVMDAITALPRQINGGK